MLSLLVGKHTRHTIDRKQYGQKYVEKLITGTGEFVVAAGDVSLKSNLLLFLLYSSARFKFRNEAEQFLTNHSPELANRIIPILNSFNANEDAEKYIKDNMRRLWHQRISDGDKKIIFAFSQKFEHFKFKL